MPRRFHVVQSATVGILLTWGLLLLALCGTANAQEPNRVRGTRVGWTWLPPTEGVASQGYSVHMSVDASSFSEIDRVEGPSYLLDPGAIGKTYVISVAGIDDEGVGPFSDHSHPVLLIEERVGKPGTPTNCPEAQPIPWSVQITATAWRSICCAEGETGAVENGEPVCQ